MRSFSLASSSLTVVGAALFGGALMLATPIGAAAQNKSAQNIAAGSCVDVELNGHMQVGINDRTQAVAIDLPAGLITIPTATSSDAYPERVDVTQTSEIWELEFLSADGSVLATSAPSGDTPDLTADGVWTGSLGVVTLDEPAIAVRARHRPDLIPDGSPNSVTASKVQLCFADSGAVPIPSTILLEPPATVPPIAEPPVGEIVEPPTVSPPTTVPPPTVPPTTSAPAPAPTSAPDPKGPTLPATGSTTAAWVLSGLWLMAAGTVAVGYSRFKSTDRA